jgi:hypothetical protein
VCQVGFSLGSFGVDPTTRGAQLALVAAKLRHENELTERFLDTTEQLDPGWRDAAEFASYGLSVTPDELSALVEAVDELIRPYVTTIRTDAPEAAKQVHAGFRAFLRIEADGKPGA